MDAQLRDFLAGLVVGLDPVTRFHQAIGAADNWQRDYLSAEEAFVAVLCSRQVGKSTATACLAWDDLTRGKQVLIAAPSERQSKELLRRVIDFRNADPCAPKIVRATLTEIEAETGGRVICVPATDSARGFTVDTLVLEEAAFLPDEAISALLPMRRDGGRVRMISTPAGRAGFFFETWQAAKVRRVFARSVDIPRLAEKVAFDRSFMPETRFRQEHLCEFLGSGTPFFNIEAVEAAFTTEVQPLWA